MKPLSQQNCRDCNAPHGEHYASCWNAPAEPDPDTWLVPENDPADLDVVDDKIVSQITGEPRKVQ